MTTEKGGSRRTATYITQLVALALVVGSFSLVRPSQAPETEKNALASRFHFTRSDIPVEQFATGEMRHKHPLHPSLDRVSAWVSCNGSFRIDGRYGRRRTPQRHVHRRSTINQADSDAGARHGGSVCAIYSRSRPLWLSIP